MIGVDGIVTKSRVSRLAAGGLTLLLACGLVSSGCEKKKGEGDSAEQKSQKKAEQEKSADKKAFKTLLRGSEPTLPADALSGVEFGMGMDAVKKKLGEDAVRSTLVDLPSSKEYERTELQAQFDSDKTGVKSFKLIYKTDDPSKSVKDALVDMIQKRWGEPDATPTEISKKVKCWYNHDKGLRACTTMATGGDHAVEFMEYVPMSEFFGADGEDFAFEKGPILGATLKELYETYGEQLDVKNDSMDSVDLGAIEKDAKFEELAKNSAMINIEFPPNQYMRTPILLNLDFGDDGTVQQYSIRMSYPNLEKDWQKEVRTLFKKKFGEPKEGDSPGIPEKVYKEDPKVSIRKMGGTLSLYVGSKD